MKLKNCKKSELNKLETKEIIKHTPIHNKRIATKGVRKIKKIPGVVVKAGFKKINVPLIIMDDRAYIDLTDIEISFKKYK